MGGPAKIDIFKHRRRKGAQPGLGSAATDTFDYVAWERPERFGETIASGVYIGC